MTATISYRHEMNRSIIYARYSHTAVIAMEGWSTQNRNGLHASIIPSPTVVIMHLLSSAKVRAEAWYRHYAPPIATLVSNLHHIPAPQHGAAVDWLVHAHVLGTRGTEQCGVIADNVPIACYGSNALTLWC